MKLVLVLLLLLPMASATCFERSAFSHELSTDLDNDGTKETITGTDYTELGTIKVSGSQTWVFQTGEKGPGYWPDEKMNVVGLAVEDIDGDKKNEVISLSSHYYWFPSRVCVLDYEGRLLQEWWNKGKVKDIDVFDIDGNGVKDVLLIANDNDYGKDYVIVLEEGREILKIQQPGKRIRGIAGGISVDTGNSFIVYSQDGQVIKQTQNEASACTTEGEPFNILVKTNVPAEIYLDGKFVCKSDYQNAVFVPLTDICLMNCEISCEVKNVMPGSYNVTAIGRYNSKASKEVHGPPDQSVELEIPDSEVVCYSGTPGDEDYCNPECKCPAGGGDCDTDADCEGDLKCIFGVGKQFGYAEDIDVCDYSGECNCKCDAGFMYGCRNWDYSIGEYNFIATRLQNAGNCGSGLCHECSTWYGMEMPRNLSATEAQALAVEILLEHGYTGSSYGYGKPYSSNPIECARYNAYFNEERKDNMGKRRFNFIHTEGPECNPDVVASVNLCALQIFNCQNWHNTC